jgi:hypothetical protein
VYGCFEVLEDLVEIKKQKTLYKNISICPEPGNNPTHPTHPTHFISYI